MGIRALNFFSRSLGMLNFLVLSALGVGKLPMINFYPHLNSNFNTQVFIRYGLIQKVIDKV